MTGIHTTINYYSYQKLGENRKSHGRHFTIFWSEIIERVAQILDRQFEQGASSATRQHNPFRVAQFEGKGGVESIAQYFLEVS